jgi:hypothetical protein
MQLTHQAGHPAREQSATPNSHQGAPFLHGSGSGCPAQSCFLSRGKKGFAGLAWGCSEAWVDSSFHAPKEIDCTSSLPGEDQCPDPDQLLCSCASLANTLTYRSLAGPHWAVGGR